MTDHSCPCRFSVPKRIFQVMMIPFFVGYVTMFWGYAASPSPDHVLLESPQAALPNSAWPSAFAAAQALPQNLREEDLAGSFTQIDFLRGEPGELIMRLDADRDITWRLLPLEPGRMQYVFSGVRAPASLARVYQLHEFAHPVKAALLRNTDEGSELIVVATGPVHMEPESGPGLLKLRFAASPLRREAIPAAAQTVPALTQGQEVLEPAADTALAEEQDMQTIFPGMDTNYIGAPISLDLQDIEVEHVLRLISEVAGYNLVLDQEVSGRVSMKLENVPWDQALDLVLIQMGLGKVEVGNILRISTLERLNAESRMIHEAKAEAARARIVEQELEPVQTAFIQVNYSTATAMDAQLRPFLTKDRGQMSHDPRTNMLIITDVPTTISKIRGIVKQLDRPERQVLIEARVVYATDEFQRGMGIRWGGKWQRVTGHPRGLYGIAGPLPPIIPGVGPGDLSGYLANVPYPVAVGPATFGIGGFISDLVGADISVLDARLELGELQGESRTVSSPRIVTLNNHMAEIKQGVEMLIQVPDERGTRTERVEAVLSLTVLPQITPGDTLILNLHVTDDKPIGEDVQKKRAQTKLHIENGQIVVLGGILKTMEGLEERRVPGAADIPLLGWLFKNQHIQDRNQELLIFIRPTIL